MIWKLRASIAVVACAMALFMEWQRPEFVVRLDEGLRDTFVRLNADQTPEERLVVIDIDETTLREIGPWPWPRERLADLVEILLGTYAVRAVGLDIVLPEPADAGGDARLVALGRRMRL